MASIRSHHRRVRSHYRALERAVIPYVRSANRRYHSRNYELPYNPDGEDFFDADWDTLIILDGCRYDTFAEHNTIPGELSARESRGSMTVEFLRGNVTGRTLHDTVYVTANGQYYHHRDDLDASFYRAEDVWREDDAWDDDDHTVLPETLTAYAKRAAERDPNKRLVVHYIQPHYPFVDSPIDIDDAFDPETPDFWWRVLVGDLDYSPHQLRQAYVANLQRALPHVQDLITSLEGKTVVTSDHGNMLGDRSFPVPMREWGHPAETWVRPLTRVPWLELQRGPRREVVAEQPPVTVDSDADAAGTAVTDHLQHLGYRV